MAVRIKPTRNPRLGSWLRWANLTWGALEPTPGRILATAPLSILGSGYLLGICLQHDRWLGAAAALITGLWVGWASWRW